MIVRELITRLGFDTRQAEAAFKRVDRQLISFKQNIATIAATMATAFTGAGFYRIIEEYSALEARTRLVTKSQEELVAVQKELSGIAQRTGTRFKSVNDLYIRLARSAQKYGFSQEQILKVTENIQKSLVISGDPSSPSASAALVQLGQGLQSGTLRGEELNSVLEQAPTLAEAIAKGMGIPFEKLREMAADGFLTPEKIIRALLKQTEEVDKSFASMGKRAGQALANLADAYEMAVYDVSKKEGVMDNFVSVFAKMQEIVQSHEFHGAMRALIGGISSLLKLLLGLANIVVKLLALLDGMAERMGGWASATQLVVSIMGGAYLAKLGLAIATTGSLSNALGVLRAAMLRIPFVALVMALGVLIDDLWSWVTDNKSMTGQLLGPWQDYKNDFIQLWDDMTDHVRESIAYIQGAVNDFNRMTDFSGAVATNYAYANRPSVIGTSFDQNKGSGSSPINITHHLHVTAPAGTEASMYKYANFMQRQVKEELARTFREVQANIAQGY